MKKTIDIIIKITILIILIFIGTLIIDKMLAPKTEDYVDEYNVDFLINHNYQKLSSQGWGNVVTDPTWLYKGETLKEKQPNKKRILIVGDSYIWGWATDNSNNLYWKQLQRMLEENGYNDVEIVASGVSGMSTYDELEFILENKEYIKKINPDLVILGFLYNDWDISNPDNELYIKKFDFDKCVNTKYNNVIYKFIKKTYPNLYNWYVNKKVTDLINDKNYNQKYGNIYGYNFWNLSDISDVIDIEKIFKDYEDNAVKRLANLDYPIIIFNSTVHTMNSFEKKFTKKALELFDKYKLEVINPEENFEKLYNLYGEKIVNNPKDTHPSDILNKFYAEEIYNYLTMNYKNIVGNKSKIKKFNIEINDYIPYGRINLKNEDNLFTFSWPNAEEMPYYWTNCQTVKLNLKYPMNLKSLKLDGDFKNPKIWINYLNEQNEYIELTNKDNVFMLKSDKKVSSINIYIDGSVGTRINLEINK